MQSGFAGEVDVVTDVVCVVTEVLVVVVAVVLELEVTLVADELVLLDSVVLVVADEVCCPGLIMTNTSAPATTNTTIMIRVATLTFDRARVCGTILSMYVAPLCSSSRPAQEDRASDYLDRADCAQSRDYA